MPRRAGKAASRRARQRAAQRGSRQPPPPSAPAAAPRPEVVPPVGTPDAREAGSLEPPRRTSPPATATGDSRLSGHNQAEYHYVERDLRNIGILTALMILLLLAAWAAFLALGLTT